MAFTVHGILQARILEWVALLFSRRSSRLRDRTQVSRTAGRFFAIWATSEAEEHWSGYPVPSPALGNQKTLWLPSSNIFFIAVVWNQTGTVSVACLYFSNLMPVELLRLLWSKPGTVLLSSGCMLCLGLLCTTSSSLSSRHSTWCSSQGDGRSVKWQDPLYEYISSLFQSYTLTSHWSKSHMTKATSGSHAGKYTLPIVEGGREQIFAVKQSKLSHYTFHSYLIYLPHIKYAHSILISL